MLKALIGTALALVLATPALAETVVIRAGSVLRDADRRPSGPATITVHDGKIVSIADGNAPAPADARVNDLSNQAMGHRPVCPLLDPGLCRPNQGHSR